MVKQIQMTVSVCSDLTLSFGIFFTPSVCCIMLLLVTTASFFAFFPYCWDAFVWLPIVLYRQLCQFLSRLVWFGLCFVSGFIGFWTIVKFFSWSLEWNLFKLVTWMALLLDDFSKRKDNFFFFFAFVFFFSFCFSDVCAVNSVCM